MREETKSQRVVVVSNRLPVTLKRVGEGWQTKKTAGGLAAAMQPVLQRNDGIWIGWTGETSGTADGNRRAIVEDWGTRHRYFGVDLDPQTAHGFYEGIANQALWPLFHHFPSLLRFDPEHWTAYVRANEIFRDEIVKHLRPNDLVWIHDYHFLLLPQLLREAAPEVSIGFFLHVPFPRHQYSAFFPSGRSCCAVSWVQITWHFTRTDISRTSVLPC